MSEPTSDARPYGGTTRAAWLATAVGIPVYAAVWAVVWAPGVVLFSSIAGLDTRATVGSDSALATIGAVNILIVFVGIAAVAHSVGRLVFARTKDMQHGQAAVIFGAMAAILALVPVIWIAVGQEHSWASAVAAFVIILVPCAVAGAAGRAALPYVDRLEALRITVIVLMVLGIVGVIVFTFYAFTGLGQ